MQNYIKQFFFQGVKNMNKQLSEIQMQENLLDAQKSRFKYTHIFHFKLKTPFSLVLQIVGV